MLHRWADNLAPNSWASRLRKRRFAQLHALLDSIATDRPLTILDMGGTPYFWTAMVDTATPPWRVTVVNHQVFTDMPPWIRSIVGDVCAVPVLDQTFDVVFSNSVIEHVGTLSDQQRMASEVLRVGRRHFIQTPNYWFPIEPHVLVPCFQFMPLSLRARLLTQRRLGWLQREPSYPAALATVSAIRLLSARQMVALFPGSTVRRERILGLTKSVTVCRW